MTRMIARRVIAASLFIIPTLAFAGGNSITIYTGGCEDADLLADVMYAADQNADALKKMAVAITVDEKKRQCGYDLQKGKRVKHLQSGLTDVDLHEELVKFFD